MIVVDSSVWIDLFRGKSTPQVVRLEKIEQLTEVVLGDIVFLEILQGARSEKEAGQLQRHLEKFGVVPMLSPNLAIKVAENYRALRRVGKTIRKTQDLIIGTYCIEHGHALLHSDRDFTPMAEHLGLRIA
ncbi:type II toxin-antitoxin system VapC family toxin [Agrobacterium rosae]|uniref:type II toxin-antitoxin system VapC family toxin n=1 Tax=Agrobacterium rosae TaxID=1972867 RepID=UPI002A171969|nr:PIN domain nuclease [Agrobacterium rosae]MDX8315662.1 PIN domain nuclease [Agrobacterium rosae]